MRRRLLVVLVGIAVTLVGTSALGRSPISILGDADFTAANGVISGSGSPDDPYLIVGWEITVGSDDAYGVQIENVTSSFVLRGLIVENAVDSNGAAIRIGLSSGGRIEDCTVHSSRNGIEIISSTGIEMLGCVIDVNGRGLRVEGEAGAEYDHSIDSTNLFNGRSIVYLHGLDGETVENHTTTHITVADSRDVTIRENTVMDGDGINLAFVEDSTVIGNAAGRNNPVLNENGIQLYQSHRNTITANLLKNTRAAGIQLSLSTENEITYNYFAVDDTGIRLVASDGNTIRWNEALGCITGIWLTGGSEENAVEGNVIAGKVAPHLDANTKVGVMLESTRANEISSNVLSDCEIGVQIYASASENRFLSNTIVAGAYGMAISGSFNEIEGNLISQNSRGLLFQETFTETTTRGNAVRRNVFSDNANHVYTNFDSTGNTFSGNAFLGDGVALVSDRGTGNAWSEGGVGNYWGEGAVEDEDGDGIGDEPVRVYPSIVDDESPLAEIDPLEAGIGILGTLPLTTVTIDREDETSFDIEVLHAVAGHERWVGFRGFPEAFLDRFPGILFEYEQEDELRFIMVTVRFDLDIAFFDADGLLVGLATMDASSDDFYGPGEPAQYAIELPAGAIDELSIGAGARLVLP